MAALANPAFLYVGSDVYTAVSAWAATTSTAPGKLIRPTAPALGNERVFCAIQTTTQNTGGSEPAWPTTKGGSIADGSVTWIEVTGQPAVNGDVTNTKDWNSAKSNTVAVGQIIKNVAANLLLIATTGGTSGSGAEPTWNTGIGATTADNTVTWTSLGLPSAFAAFAAPHARILNADAATWQTVAGGNKIFVSASHAESQGSALTLSGGQGTIANPNQYLCVANNVAPPTACTTGASVTTTGAFALGLQLIGTYVGINLSSATGANNISLNVGTTAGFNTEHALTLENCGFNLGGTTGGSVVFGNTDPASATNGYINVINPTFTATATSHKIAVQNANVTIIGGKMAATGTVPTTAFTTTIDTIINAEIRDFDMSAVTGTILSIATGGGENVGGFFNMHNCKIGSGVAMTSGGPSGGPGDLKFRMHNCDNGTKNYRFYEKDYLGTVQQETTIINNAGATDLTQRLSFNIATSANTHFNNPYVLEYTPIAAWQDTTGSSKTATIEIAGSATLTNADIWMELEYPGSSASPLGSVVNCRAADILATPANVTTSAASWGGSPAFTQKLQVTFTPQMKGWIKARIFVAKPSITVYIDPLLTVV